MRAIVALSGGMDSATVLAKAISEGFEIFTVGFEYGAKHNAFENQKARELANHYKVPFILINLVNAFSHFQSDLLLSGGEIPEGHYEEKSMERTVVPGRNIIFLSLLSGYAWSVNAKKIYVGIHQGDHAIYADCRFEFYEAMNIAIKLGTDSRVEIEAPFLGMDKAGILKWGIPNKVPYEKTRTCYKNQEKSCGKCGSCRERLEAFQKLGLVDPVPYDSDFHVDDICSC